MSQSRDVTVPATRRARKSLSGLSPSRKTSHKENATVDVSSASLATNRKKSRSKSIGPGGLDALKPAHGNRRQSLAITPAALPRSILKPTIPILPEIPPHNRKPAVTRNDSDYTKVALRTEEEQQAAAREREERERAALEKEVKDRREARRKSLANRRVSFAAEATLHTFHEIEYLQDPTTSSDSTRRASSLAAQSPATQTHLESLETSGTLPHRDDDDDDVGPASPGMSPLDANDVTMGSTVYDSDSDNGDDVIEDPDEGDSDSDAGDGTMMTLDADDITTASAVSAGSLSMMSSEDSTTSIDEMLRLATQRAGVRTTADEDEEVIPAFIGWGKKAQSSNQAVEEEAVFSSPVRSVVDEEDDDSAMDMEETRAMGGIIQVEDADQTVASEGGMDMSMDMTRPLGGIVSQRRATQREATMCLDQTMDFTTPLGGIQSTSRPGEQQEPDEDDEDEESRQDMTMEFTTVMGGVWSADAAAKGGKAGSSRRATIRPDDSEVETTMAMDMTVGLGNIITAATSREDRTEKEKENSQEEDADDNDDDGEMTMGMEMSPVALGGILASVTRAAGSGSNLEDSATASPPKTASPAKNARTPGIRPRTPTKNPSPTRQASGRSPVHSPDRSPPKGNELRRSPERRLSPVRVPPPKRSTHGSLSPQQSRTPSRVSPSRFIGGSGSASPARVGSAARSKPATPKSPLKPTSPTKALFQQDPTTGATTPLISLTPQRRRLSGIGADRSGLGSPKITQLLGRRASIGEAAREFSPGKELGLGRHNVRWEDPRVMEQEEDRQRQHEVDKEDGRKIMEREADEREVTLNLREMIQGLSPKKNPLRGRKSLHVGSAKGLLGKRPSELDDEEDEQQDGVKRLKNHQGSPVKSIRLQQPPSKEETTGRLSKASKSQDSTTLSLGVATPTSPLKASIRAAISPQRQGHFRDVENDGPIGLGRGGGGAIVDASELDNVDDDDDEPISLQDFLNMTSIRFMELTTTKRRHTVAPQANKHNEGGDDKDDVSFERCVVAGACTVPMLELYQHSCRELKKYISEGRDIVREIESETLADNPPLFREYMSASPEFKVLMDGQFKNVKTHARLLSKAMWYEWRMKLQEGLKEGLDKIAEGLAQDDQMLKKQQALVDSVLPKLVQRFAELEKEHELLEEAARELADCDPDELQAAREELVAATQDMDAKKREIAELEQELREAEVAVEDLTKQKQLCLDEIREAERVREECRGWSSAEIMALKARVEELEQEHGWSVTGCSGTMVSMAYGREIELVWDPSTFGTAGGAQGQTPRRSNVDLWYTAGNRERDARPLTPELDFFLQCLREQVRGLDPARTTPRRVLDVVASGWRDAKRVAAHVRGINCTFPTAVVRTSDASLAVRCTLLLPALQTKVEVRIDLLHAAGAVRLEPRARVIYGQRFNEDRMTAFLAKEIGDSIGGGGQAWGEAVVELYAKLLSGANKQ